MYFVWKEKQTKNCGRQREKNKQQKLSKDSNGWDRLFENSRNILPYDVEWAEEKIENAQDYNSASCYSRLEAYQTPHVSNVQQEEKKKDYLMNVTKRPSLLCLHNNVYIETGSDSDRWNSMLHEYRYVLLTTQEINKNQQKILEKAGFLFVQNFSIY